MKIYKFWSSSNLVIPFIFLITIFIQDSTSLNFDFHSFNSNIAQNKIIFQGDASVSTSSGQQVIELTRNPLRNAGSSYGRAIYKEELHLWDENSGNATDFFTHFSFVINSHNSSESADGMTFYLAPEGFPFPNQPQGSGLALLNRNETLDSGKKFLAVEFDTYANEWDPGNGLPHVGIDINNLRSVSVITWDCDIQDGKRNEAWIKYSSLERNLTVTVTGFVGNKMISQSVSSKVDLKDILPGNVTVGFSAATGTLFETHTLTSWRFSSWTVKWHPEDKRNTALIVGLSAGTCVISVVALIILFWWMRRHTEGTYEDLFLHRLMDDEFEGGFGPKRFSHKLLAKATHNFSEKEKLGEGGSGSVYRGYLKDVNSYVAVKKISRGYKQGLQEFATEIKVISRLRHRNLVQLLGWCHEKDALLLVYEFMSNGSLDAHLFKRGTPLIWDLRYKITQGLAAGLLYLHEEWEQCVVHRDIKSSNLMLDSDFNAKLGDFGLARLVDHEKGSRTTILAGTMGYMAPEYATTGKASKEVDVYSFGIVALEIACGRKPVNLQVEENEVVLLEWVWDLYSSGRLLEAADPRLNGVFDNEQMERMMIVGMWCAHPDSSLRPSIRQAIQALNFETPLPALPLKMPVATYFSLMAGMPTPQNSMFHGLAVSTSTQNEVVRNSPKATGSQTTSSISAPTSDVLPINCSYD